MNTVEHRRALIVGASNLAAAAALAARQREYDVHMAANALHALALMARRRVDVVVCEPDLPGRSAAWLADEIRRSAPEVRAVVLRPHEADGRSAEIERIAAAAFPADLPARRVGPAQADHADPVEIDRHAAVLPRDRRQSARWIPATGEAGDVRLGPGRRAVVVDRSATGIRIRADFRVLPGVTVDLRDAADGGSRRGRIVWSAVASVAADSLTYEAGVCA